jgi:hypothetical protein
MNIIITKYSDDDYCTRIAKRCNECLECRHFCNGCDGDSEPCEAFEYTTH